MKKLIALAMIIMFVISAAACGKSAGTNGDAEQTGEISEISTELIDPDHPLTDADSGSYSRIGDDGVTYEGSYRYPKIIHETLTGADFVNSDIKKYFDDTYGKIFAEGSGDKLFLTVDYSYTYERDMLAVLITAEKKASPDDEPVYEYQCFFYDALVDVEIAADEYLAFLGHSAAELFNAVTAAYPDANLPESGFEFALFRSSETDESGTVTDAFDVYFTGSHGDRIFEVEVEKSEPDIGSFDVDDVITLN